MFELAAGVGALNGDDPGPRGEVLHCQSLEATIWRNGKAADEKGLMLEVPSRSVKTMVTSSFALVAAIGEASFSTIARIAFTEVVSSIPSASLPATGTERCHRTTFQ
jgi:hypothetical protein